MSEQLGARSDERSRNQRLLIICTNELYSSVEESLGTRMASRLFDDATGIVKQVYLDAPDYRARSSHDV